MMLEDEVYLHLKLDNDVPYRHFFLDKDNFATTPGDEIARQVTAETTRSEARKLNDADPHYYKLTHGLIFAAYLSMKYLKIMNPKYQLHADDTVLDVIKKFIYGKLYNHTVGTYQVIRFSWYRNRDCIETVGLHLCNYHSDSADYFYPIMLDLLFQYVKKHPSSNAANIITKPFNLDLAKIIGKLNFDTIFKDLESTHFINYLGYLDFLRGLILLFPDDQDKNLERIKKLHNLSDLIELLEGKKQLARLNRILHPNVNPALLPKTAGSKVAEKEEIKEPPLKKAKTMKASLIKESRSPVFSDIDSRDSNESDAAVKYSANSITSLPTLEHTNSITVK